MTFGQSRDGVNIVPFRALTIRDAGALQGKAVPVRDWLIKDILIRRGITLLGGDGGTGKSLLCLQLQVAAALGEPWLGIPMPTDGMVSFGYYCEDDDDELHRRLYAICRHYNVEFAQIEGRVLYASRVGMNNELMVFNGRNDRGVVTKTFNQLEELVKLNRVDLTIIDTVADAFMGNENIRPQVRAFVNAMRKLSLINNGGTIITAHPSRAGLVDGSGLSGSTGWNGSVRARCYFSKPKSNDKDEDEPTDERELKTMKSNYGADGGKIKVKWQGVPSTDSGVFVLLSPPSVGGVLAHLDARARLLDAARYFVKKGSFLSADPRNKSSLVVLARKLPTCKELHWNTLRTAQDSLEESGDLVKTEMGPKSKRRLYIRPAQLRYPGEDTGVTEKSIPDSADPDGNEGEVA